VRLGATAPSAPLSLRHCLFPVTENDIVLCVVILQRVMSGGFVRSIRFISSNLWGVSKREGQAPKKTTSHSSDPQPLNSKENNSSFSSKSGNHSLGWTQFSFFFQRCDISKHRPIPYSGGYRICRLEGDSGVTTFKQGPTSPVVKQLK